MKYQISKLELDEIHEEIKCLEDRLTDMISDLHQVKGGVQARHAFMYYRSILYSVKYRLNEKCKPLKDETLP
jgi:septation ring formation regulator EzrA